MAEKQILIVCGEPSGELHAAELVTELKKIDHRLKVLGVGSTMLARAGADIIFDTKDLSVMGFFEALKKLPRFYALKNLILDKIKTRRPQAIIFVDFSGFNLRLAKAINNSLPAIYYVSPQVWASRAGRVKTIKKYIRKMIVFFKFEQVFYKKHALEVDFVGHPLLDIARPSTGKEEFIRRNGLDMDKQIIALLPGSRKQEIKRILPAMLKSAELIKRNTEAQVIIAKPEQLSESLYKKISARSNADAKIISGKTYDCLNAASLSLVCSGTATLEAAIIGNPFLIIYKTSWLNYLLYKPLVKVPYIGMVNIVAGKEIIPELIQSKATPQRIAKEALRLMESPAEAEKLRQELEKIKALLGEPQAAARAARIIWGTLTEVPPSG
jgi:lipid-A-disaccharide synthase